MDRQKEQAGGIQRDLNLDMIKILCCIGVVGLHSFQENMGIANLGIYHFCGFSIPAFFVCSGYCLIDRNVSMAYSVRKILRILGVVIAWNIIFHVIHELLNGNVSFISWGGVILKSVIKGFIQQGRFWHFWYLAALMFIYALLPLLCKFVNPNMKKRVLIPWLICLITGIVLQWLSEFIFHDSLQRHIVQPLRLWTWLQYFLLGGILKVYRGIWMGKGIGKQTGIGKEKRFGKGKEALAWLVFTSMAIQFYQLWAGRLMKVQYGEAFYDSVLTVVWVTILFVFVMKLKLNDRVQRVVAKAAPCTMGVYMIHPILIRYMKRAFYPDTFLKSLILFIVLSIISFVLAYVMKKIPLMKKLVSL